MEEEKIPPRDIYMPKEELFKDYGVLDETYKYPNPLNGKLYSEKYKSNITGKGFGVFKLYEKLTIWQNKELILKTIYENQCILVIAGTSSGKTVMLPKLALHTTNYKGKVAMTNPKIIPSQVAAEFSAKTLDVKLGEEVGYNFKGAPKESHSDESKIVFLTDGIIKSALIRDPILTQYDIVIIDEAHERNTNIDILFLLLRRALILRPSLKLIITSATIDENVFIKYFPTSFFKFKHVFTGAGTTYPIDKYYLKKPINRFNDNGEVIGQKFVDAVARKVCDILTMSSKPTIIMCFLTGSADTKKACETIRILLNSLSNNISNETFLIPVSSGINKLQETLAVHETYFTENFDDAKQNDPTTPNKSTKFRSKVIVTTELFESSLTAEGLEYVVDAGLSKQSKYYPNENINALEKKYIAKSNQLQRFGRSGRNQRGIAYGLYTENELKTKFRDYPIPPIINTNASPLILDFMLLEQYISHIEFPITDKKIPVNLDIIKREEKITLNQFLNELLDIPHIDNLQQSVIRLYYLGLIKITDNKGFISSLGKFIGKIRMGSIEMRRALVSSYNYKCVREVCAIASMLEVLGTKYMTKLFTTKEPTEIINLWKPETGEFILLLDIFNEFVHREYDQIFYDNGRKIKIKKIGGTKYWCKKMKINYNQMVRIYAVFEDNFRSFNRLVREEVELYLAENMYNTEDNFLLYTEQRPILYQDTRLNVIRALLDGFFVNVIKKNNNLTFNTIYPSIQKGTLDPRQTLFTNIDDTNFKYCFYYSFDKVSLNKSFLLVNGIPKDVLKDVILDNDKYDIFKKGLTI